MIPTVGRIVHYRLSAQDAAAVNKRRADAERHKKQHVDLSVGVQIHVGNPVDAGDTFPLVITRIWGNTEESYVNGQVMLDGNDLLWVTSVCQGEGPRTWSQPPRV